MLSTLITKLDIFCNRALVDSDTCGLMRIHIGKAVILKYLI
jgi:hypothetical protein